MTTGIMEDTCDFNSFGTNLLVGGLFFTGMIAGISLAAFTAPNSQTAMFIGFMVWPLSFGVGMSLWYSLASSKLPRKLIRALFKSLQTWNLGDSLRLELADMTWKSTKTTRIFVPTIVITSFFAGLIVACTPNALDFELVVCSFTGFGLAYSMFVTWLARHGILPPPKAC